MTKYNVVTGAELTPMPERHSSREEYIKWAEENSINADDVLSAYDASADRAEFIRDLAARKIIEYEQRKIIEYEQQ